MLLDRNYAKVKEYPYYHIYKDNSTNNKLIIIYSNTTKLNIKCIKEYIQLGKNINHYIIIYQNCITPAAKKSIRIFDQRIEIFNKDHILPFPKPFYHLIPKHEKIEYTPSTIKNILNNVNIKDIPKILQQDAMCRYYGFQVGDLLKITRKNNNIVYRIVI